MKKKLFIITAISLIGVATGVFVIMPRQHNIKHIVLISMDTTRADHLSCYGYPKNTTPNIDALAQNATRFEKVNTPVPLTLAAHSSMMTGRIPPAHGVHYNHARLADSNLTLAEILKSEGYTTGGIISAYVLYRQFGLAQGFDSYNDSFKEAHDNAYGQERKGAETTQAALDWLEQNKDDKFFLFLHYYDPHDRYVPPEPFASEFAGDPYAGEIAFTDDCIGKVIQQLKELNIYDSTLLIITGDHGEMLGEHGEDTHAYFIYESAIKVPLIVKLPKQKKGHMISQPVGLIDIVPTLCSLLEIAPPTDIQGQNISPMLYGKIPANYERILYDETMGPGRVGASSLMAVTHGKWKYIQAPRPELYDLAADPGEEHNLAEQEHQRARILQDNLREVLEQSVRTDTDSHTTLDAAAIKKLESLGYVAGKSTGELDFDEGKPDPKDSIHIYAQLEEGISLYKIEKDYNQARQILEELIPQCPDLAEIYKHLGDICHVQGDDNQAIRYYRRTYEIAPNTLFYPLLNDIAWVQATHPSLEARDVHEAVKYAEDACERVEFKDPASLDTLAVCYAAAGDFDKAVKTARKAVQIASMTDKGLAKQINERLNLFKQHKPYIEE